MVGGEDSRTPFYQGTGNDLGGEESICGLSFSRRLATFWPAGDLEDWNFLVHRKSV
jgi:hypothetical protein